MSATTTYATRCIAAIAVILALLPLYGVAAAAPSGLSFPAATHLQQKSLASPSFRSGQPGHKPAPARLHLPPVAQKVKSATHLVHLSNHAGPLHPFSATFVRRLKAATQQTAPRLDPRHAVDVGRIVSVGNGRIVVRQEPLFKLARGAGHTRALYTTPGLAPEVAQVVISSHTLVTTAGAGGLIRRYGSTAGLHAGDTVAVAGSLANRDLRAVAVAELSPSKVRAISQAELQMGRRHVQQVQLRQPRLAHQHSLEQQSSQNGQFEGCIPDPSCTINLNSYSSIQETYTAPTQENQGGLTLYDDGVTKIYLQSVGYTINVADYVFNWPMVFTATAPDKMNETQQSAISLSVQPQQITQGSFTFAGGIGVSFAAYFNVTIAGSTYQTSASAAEGIVDTTSDPAPLAGSNLDISGASNCMSLVGLDIKQASLASASVCVNVHFEGENVGVRYVPNGANLVDAVGNPVASPAQGSLSATPEPLWVVPTQNNWSLGLDHFYWAPKMSLSGYLSFAAAPGIGPANVQCSCLTWNSPAVQFPGYPQNIPMVDTIPNDAYARQQLVHLGSPDGPQTSSLTYSYTSTPAPTVLTYTGGTDFNTGNNLGVSAKLVDNQGNPVVGGVVNFRLAGRTCTSSADAVGTVDACQINIQGVTPGQYTLSATYAGGNGYAPSSVSPTVSLSSTSLTMTYVGHTSDLGQNSSFFAVDIRGLNSTITSQTPDIATLAITFYLGGRAMCSPDYTNSDDSHWIDTGVLELSCYGFLGNFNASPGISIGFDAGAYTVVANLAPSPYFTLDPVTAPFTIEKLPTTLTGVGGGTAAYHGSLTLSSTLSSQYGYPSDQPVLYILGSGSQSQSCQGQTAYPTGVSSCTLSTVNLPPGTYPLAISYAGSNVWGPSSTSVSVTVTKGTSTLTYTGPGNVVYHQKGVALSATLAQPNSSVDLVGQTVHFALGSQSCDATTDIHGQADCEIGQITQQPGTPLTVSYAGSALYQGTSINPSLAITPAASALTYTGLTSAVYHGAVVLSGTLVEPNGGAAIAGQPVHFILGSGFGSQSCDGVTDPQGKAACAISSITATPGNVPVTAIFAGNLDYLPNSATASLTLSKADVHLAYNGGSAADVHDGVTLSGTLTERSDGSGPGIANQPIVLSLGSQSCQGTTDPLGHASCTLAITQAPGAATVTISFAGNADFNPTSANAPFTVNKEETAITYTGSLQPVANGQSATLSATLADPTDQAEGENTASPIAGETVTLTLGSQTCTGTTAPDGTVSCTITAVNQATGELPVAASFAGDGSYLPSSSTGKQVLAFSYLGGGGSFVVGDKSVAGASASTPLTWWGSDWASANSLTAGPAPSSFKGFAPSFSQNGAPTASPTCGATYSFDSTGGNSSNPPAASSIPAYMAVAVSSQITQSGKTITGNISKIVIVKTDPGYASNAGHTGTGTVVATVCG